jgi:hypothetical protein
MYNFEKRGYYHVDESLIAKLTGRVLMWMFAGLLVTFAASFMVLTNQTLMVSVANAYLPIIIVQFGLVLGMSAMINKISVTAAKLMFLMYSGLTGVTLSLFVLMFNPGSVVLALAMTVIIFGIMAVYGYVTKEDLSKFGSLLRIGIIALIVMSLFNIFFQSSAMFWVISYLGVLIFIGFIGYDMNNIKKNLIALSHGDEAILEKYSVFGALMLYLDFINLFIYILRIVGGRSRD